MRLSLPFAGMRLKKTKRLQWISQARCCSSCSGEALCGQMIGVLLCKG